MSAQSAIYNPSQTTSAATGDGFSVPRLTTTGRLAITFTTKDAGMMVYDTDLDNLFIWNGSAWESVPASGDAGANGSVQYNDNGVVSGAVNFVWDSANNRVGIGTATPVNTLEVVAPAGDNIVSTFRSGDATAANNAGGGFRSISSATAANRVAQVWLDADGANFSGGDYFFIQKNGGSGTVEFNQSSNAAMVFLTNSTEQMRLNSTGLGVGTTNYIGKIQAAGLVAAADPTFGTSGTFIGAILNNDNTAPGIDLRRWTGAAANHGTTYISTDFTGNTYFYNGQQPSNTKATALRLLINTNGVLVFNGGNASSNGVGINFPATQVASSDANTLDDYEEGNWIATLKGSVSDPTTPVTATGRYTKIGRQVSIQLFVNNVITTGASGRIQIDGLPFANNGVVEAISSVGFYNMATFTGVPFGLTSASSTVIDMWSSVSAGVFQAVNYNPGTVQYVWVNLTYTI